MRDPYNPLPEDLKAWAYTDGAVEPVQDWDLLITDVGRAPKFIEFASDARCPNADYFLQCLYLLVGDAVRTKGLSSDLERLQALLQNQRLSRDLEIRTWVQRSLKLIQNPESFQYDDWCSGGLAADLERDF